MARLSKIAKLVAAGSEDKVENIFIQNLKATIENTQSEYRPSTFYKPSGVGGCIRSMYFQRVGNVLQQKSDSNLIAMGESGTFRHEVIQEYLVKMSERLADEEFLWVNVEKYLEENPVEGTTVDANFKKNDYETKCKNSNLQLSFLCDGLVMLKVEGRAQGRFFPLCCFRGDEHGFHTVKLLLTAEVEFIDKDGSTGIAVGRRWVDRIGHKRYLWAAVSCGCRRTSRTRVAASR